MSGQEARWGERFQPRRAPAGWSGVRLCIHWPPRRFPFGSRRGWCPARRHLSRDPAAWGWGREAADLVTVTRGWWPRHTCWRWPASASRFSMERPEPWARHNARFPGGHDAPDLLPSTGPAIILQGDATMWLRPAAAPAQEVGPPGQHRVGAVAPPTAGTGRSSNVKPKAPHTCT